MNFENNPLEENDLEAALGGEVEEENKEDDELEIGEDDIEEPFDDREEF